MFKIFLPDSLYKHFLLLHFAIYAFCSDSYANLWPNAKRCIEIFVQQMESLFGTNSLSHNLHVFRHLHEFVEMYGNLNKFSAFPFENHLSHVKKRIRVTHSIFQHVLNQFLSVRDLLTTSTSASLFFSVHSPNNCTIIDDQIVCISHQNGLVFSGNALRFSTPLYTYPYSSHAFRIGYYSLTRKIVAGTPSGKCILFPITDS